MKETNEATEHKCLINPAGNSHLIFESLTSSSTTKASFQRTIIKRRLDAFQKFPHSVQEVTRPPFPLMLLGKPKTFPPKKGKSTKSLNSS